MPITIGTHFTDSSIQGNFKSIPLFVELSGKILSFGESVIKIHSLDLPTYEEATNYVRENVSR